MNRLDNLALGVVEDLVEARYTKEKAAVLKRANLKMEKLRVLFRISHSQGYLHHGSFEYTIKALDEAGRMLGGWLKMKEKAQP